MGRSPPWENSQELLKPSSQRAKVKNVDCFVILPRPARREQLAHCRKLCRLRIRDSQSYQVSSFDYDKVDDRDPVGSGLRLAMGGGLLIRFLDGVLF